MRTLSNIVVIVALIVVFFVFYYDITLDDIRTTARDNLWIPVLLSMALAVLFKRKWPAVLCAFLILPMAYIGYNL